MYIGLYQKTDTHIPNWGVVVAIVASPILLKRELHKTQSIQIHLLAVGLQNKIGTILLKNFRS